MKKKTILYLVSLFFLSVPLTGRGQDRKAWEIGAGGSLINWSRVSVTGFQSTPDNYMYNLKANHLMGGANLYVARELNRWFYLDLQGTVGVAKNKNRIAAVGLEKTKKKVNDLKIKTKCQELILIHYWKPVVTSVT